MKAICLSLCLCIVACGDPSATAEDATATSGPCGADPAGAACTTCKQEAEATCRQGTCESATTALDSCATDGGCVSSSGPCYPDEDTPACETCESEANTKCEAAECLEAYQTWDACLIEKGCVEQPAGGGHWEGMYDEPCADEHCPEQVKGLDDCQDGCPAVQACWAVETDQACVSTSCKTEHDALNECFITDCQDTKACN